MKQCLIILLMPFMLWHCSNNSVPLKNMFIMESSINQVVDSVKKKNPSVDVAKLEKGLTQVAGFWTKNDGSQDDFVTFCIQNYITSQADLDTAFNKVSTNLEVILGHNNKIALELMRPLHLDMGPLTPIDEMFGSVSVDAHFVEDMFASKIAFYVILNFPRYSLKEKTEQGASWNRKQWVYARLGDVFIQRVPAVLNQQVAKVGTEADIYISGYNIYVGNLLTNDNKTLFPKEMKLLSHWGLRDEIKANYGKENGLEKQRMIYQVMKRIITQEVPRKVIDNAQLQWNPFTNKVIENGKEIAADNENDARYQHILNNFKALAAIDPYSGELNTFIKRKFEEEIEIPQEDVEKLFIEYLSSPEVKQVAAVIKKRLGRDLEPFDLWYDGFKARSTYSTEELDGITKTKYANNAAFQKGIPEILVNIGFTKEKAEYLASRIEVDPARGSGHAWGAQMRSEKAHLRTRIGSEGMNYKGYNVAMHELGHNVEQTISLQDVDYYLLNGVPGTGFTEALAFIFQRRDLAVLGKKDNDPNKEYTRVLDDFWSLYEIMGVSLVDMNVWKWMYSHPNASAAELKGAVLTISIDIWNKYYAEAFGVKDQPILAIYSHMISNPLYLSNYSLGHLIDFQIEKQIAGKNFGDEIERIYKQGDLIPQVWMQQAVGNTISNKPVLEAVDEALKHVN